MFMNNIRKRYDPHLAPREMADGACQPGQTCSRPGSAHSRYPPERDDGPGPAHLAQRPPIHGHRPSSGPPYGTRRGSTDHVVLPGTLGRPEEDGRAPAPPPGIISTTEFDRNSASQRGVEERRPYLPSSYPGSHAGPRQAAPPPRPRHANPPPTCTPPPPPPQAQQAWTSGSSSGSIPNVPPKQFGSTAEAVREAVSLTVEERLRSLLTGGGGQQPQAMKAPPSGYQQPHPAHQVPPQHQQQAPHHGQVNSAYHYDDGELLLPPPRAAPDNGPRRGLENGGLQDERGVGHHHQGSLGSDAELQSSSYVPSRPSDRMSGMSRGQALHAPRPPHPGGPNNAGPPLPPKCVGQPPRYQPPPQYSPYQRRPGDTNGGPPPANGPSNPTGSTDLRNMCNKLYTRDNQPPYSNTQQGSPNAYGHPQQQQQPQQQQWARYGNPSGQQQGGAPRTSPMGQSSSATSSHASGQGSSNHSPSSPSLRRPAPPHPPPGGSGEYPPERRPYIVENRLSTASNPPYQEPSSLSQLDRAGGQEKRLSSASVDRQKIGYLERPELSSLPSSAGQGPDVRTNKGGGIDIHTGPGGGPGPTSRLAAARLQTPAGKNHPGAPSSSLGMRGNNLELADLTGRGAAGPESAAAVAHHVSQMALKVPKAKWRDSLASEEGGNYSPSISSSRSVTPPLPPLSPDNTPPHTPPESPSARHHRPLVNGTAPVGFLARTPDVVTSTALKKPAPLGGKKKPARRAMGAPAGVKAWDGRGKRTANGKAGKRINLSKPPRPPGMIGMPGISGDADYADDDTLTNTSFTEADYATVHGATGSGALEVHEARIIRQQLEGLETMYHEILKLLGLDREYMPGSRRSISSTSSISRSGRPRMKRNHSTQHRSRDLKQVNKRFARLESHVVTLARSVAHLSSEMRTHNGLCTDVEEIKRELVRLKDAAISKPPQVFLNEWERFRGWVPSLTNPKRVNKLTKFFGQEPPLLNIFLKKLGYEKYTTNFEQEKIGMIELPYMNEDRLQRIGIPMGPRLRILQEAQLCFRQENFDIYIV